LVSLFALVCGLTFVVSVCSAIDGNFTKSERNGDWSPTGQCRQF
jgi:hypothetical protein